MDWSWFLFLFIVIVWLSSFYGDILDDPGGTESYLLAVLPAILAILGMDFFNRHCPWERVSQWPLAARVGIQATLLVFVVARWGREASPFIYFQF